MTSTFIHIEEACRLACEQIGIDYKAVTADGRFHLADISNDPRGKNDARIKIFPDRQGGIVWNHKSGEQQTFFTNRNQEPIPETERKRIQHEQQKQQTERVQRQNKAAQIAQTIWQQAQPAPKNHPYLIRKHIKPHRLRVGQWQRLLQQDDGKQSKLIIDNVLLVPMVDKSGSIRGLQAIFPEKSPELDRDKDFLAGCSLTGLFWWLGDKTDKILIAEGFATAATLHQETAYRVYLAFTANNLLAVGQLIREQLPHATLVFCADNDSQTIGNPGLTKATQAAHAVGGYVVAPPGCGDFNDWFITLQGANHESTE